MAFFTYIGLIIVIYYLIYLVVFFVVDCDVTLVLAEKFGKKRSKLKGKVVWITEADNDLGEALTYEIAENNGMIILSGSRSDELELIKEKCLQINPTLKPHDIMIVSMDLTKTETHKSCFKCALRHFGVVDIFICNGGKTERAIWEEVDISADRQLFESNVFGIISLSRIAVHYFSGRGKGHIVVISRLAGIIGVPYSSAYAASAHALHGYFESLRNEKLGTSLQVTLLYSGPVSSKYQDFILPGNGNQKKSNDEWRRTSAKRYARLSVIAVVNKLDEAWMAPPPIIPLVYAVTNFPNVSRIITRIISKNKNVLFKRLANSEGR